jgi:drug/metabolite transporter (DMT)-like permease
LTLGNTPPRSTQPIGVQAALLALLTSALWGGTPVAIRFTTDSLPPVMVAAIRFALAAIFMVGWCRFERSGFAIAPGQSGPILVATGLLFVQIWSFNIGVAWSNASHGSLFINTFIFWVPLIEHFVTGDDRLTRRKSAGLALAAAAALSVVVGLPVHPPATAILPEGALERSAAAAPIDQPTLAGDLLLASSAVVLAAKIVYTKRAVRQVEPGKLIFWHHVGGTLLFVAYSLVFEVTHASGFTPSAVAGLLYQGLLVAGLCFAIQAVQLARYSASQISIFSAATPVFGVAFGAWLRGDAVSPWLAGGAVGVAAGIWLVTREASRVSP